MTLVVILFVAFVLRIVSINQSLWLDEASTALAAGMGVKGILTVFSRGDFHPPLYYIITHFWSLLFGLSEVSLRIPSVIVGVGTIFVTYLIGRELKDKKTGMVAGGLMATSGLHIYYSQEARMYAFAALFVSLTFLFFVKTLKKGRVGEWGLLSLFLALSASVDYLPAFILPTMVLFAVSEKLKPNWWKKYVTSHIILLIAGVLWLPYFLNQFTQGLLVKAHSPFWWKILGETNFKQLILIPTKFVFGRIDMEPNLVQISIVATVLMLLSFLLVKALKSYKKTKVLWFWLFIPLILAGVISFWIPTLSYFRFLFVLPAFYLLMAVGITNLSKKLFAPALGVFIVFNLVTSGMYLKSRENHREDWRGLTVFVKAESQGKNSAVVFVAGSQMEAYRYYDKDVKILTAERLSAELDQIWLMRYVKDIFDPEDLTRKKVEDLGYRKASEYDFNGVVVWKYEK